MISRERTQGPTGITSGRSLLVSIVQWVLTLGVPQVRKAKHASKNGIQNDLLGRDPADH